MDSRLEVTVNGIKFENPFILASAPPTASGDLIRNAFNLGWAGAVVKTIRDVDVYNSNVSPRLAVLRNKNSVVGLENIEMISDRSIFYWLREIYNLKKEYPGKVVIGSIMGARGVDSWQKIAKRIADVGADALELNFSCPNGVTAQGVGLAIGQDLAAIEMITSGVKKVVNIPVIVKLTPNVTDIASTAAAAVQGGADGICAINTVSALIGIDIETLNPLPDINGYSTFGGLSGLCVKPIGLRCVAQIAKAVDVPIHATGGISTWKDFVEYAAVGASTAQICTEVMLKGLSVIDALKKGLTDYMKRKSFLSIGDFRGTALSKLTSHIELSRDYKVKAVIDTEKCSRCGNCINICAESGANSLFENGTATQNDKEKCFGCSLCSYICPKYAISMIPVS
ncbi:MAG: NAD-dependent dihydropyrimidine dehydrogenase subunit PreA [Syntrophothermus sp.]